MTAEPSEDGLQMKVIWESDLLQDIIDALDALVKEAKFHFLDELIRIWVIDPANVAGCYIDLIPSDWDEIQHYSVQEGGFTMGVNTGKLDDILGYASAGDPLQIEYGEKHKWAFNITLPGVDVNLAGIDPDSVRQEPDHPGLEDELAAHYQMDGDSLDDAAKLNDMFSDHTTVAVEDHQVFFIGEGDTDDGTYSLEEGEGELQFHRHPDERVESMFSLDYLKDMGKVLKHYDGVDVYSGQDHPIMFETELFQYMLAPRIDSNK
jgi:proliferating cell nuclear antigen